MDVGWVATGGGTERVRLKYDDRTKHALHGSTSGDLVTLTPVTPRTLCERADAGPFHNEITIEAWLRASSALATRTAT